MKKLLLISVLAMLMSLVSCMGKDGSSDKSGTIPSPTESIQLTNGNSFTVKESSEKSSSEEIFEESSEAEPAQNSDNTNFHFDTSAPFGKFCNFYDQENGSLFIPIDDYSWRFSIFTTNDGGKTWRAHDENETLSSTEHEKPIMAKFITNEVGIVGYRYFGDADMRARTYITKDGGKTWIKISGISYPFDESHGTEAFDLTYQDNSYTLTVKVYDGDEGYYIKYKSNDLLNWEYVE